MKSPKHTQILFFRVLPIVMTLLFILGCHSGRRQTQTVEMPVNTDVYPELQPGQALVEIQTSQGLITVLLYANTPIHRDNFLKLATEGFYDSLLFHRVIRNFVIQGGDPGSKKADRKTMLGNGDVGYTLPAEIQPGNYHKRGALGAARESDFVTPERESSGCQFYIVQGKTWTDSLLSTQAKRINKFRATNNIIRNPEHKNLVQRYKANMNNSPDSMKAINAQLDKLIAKELETLPSWEFSEEEKKIYKTKGGTPHLDGSYTVFGEVVRGMEVVDKIAALITGDFDRPLTDVRIKKMRVLGK
jgi:peptidylprolyl isomerase